MLQFDEKQAKQVETTYMTPDVVEQRRATRALLALQPGEKVLDIGSGPGFLADEMAAEVGPEGAVHGVDPSESMLAIARRRESSAQYALGDAVSLPFDDETFDAAIATQVYEYVPDMPAALAEVRRVLRPGGRLLILDTDWDAIVWHSSDRDRMLRVLEKWNGHLADPYLPRRLPKLLRDADFKLASTTVIPILNQGAETATLSHGVMPLVAEFVDDQGWKEDLLAMGEDYFFSLNRYVFVAYRTGVRK
jgi:arsenite methyltransferase